jgi:predicted AAA+ superfamily ATPase
MVYIPRILEAYWKEANRQFPVLLLTGPRQVGKTTFLTHLCGKERTYVSLDDPTLRSLATEEPALFMQRFSFPLLIDEIQYAPQLLSYIKMSVDAHRRAGMYWLTGSQQFSMMKGVSETLAGRVGIVNLLGFSQFEQNKSPLSSRAFLPIPAQIKKYHTVIETLSLPKLYKRIWTGSFPAMVTGQIRDWNLFYTSYVQTYLERDVKDLIQVGNQSLFLRFTQACAARTGQLLNLSQLAHDVDITVNTAKSWLSILQANFQVFLLPPYHTNVTKRLIKTPKLYFLDTGLCSFLTEWTTPQTLEAGAMSGAILETFALSELLKSWWYQGKQPHLFYYRDKDGNEVDFLIHQDRTLFPIEVKKSANPKSDWLKGFHALNKLKYPIGSGAVLCLCKEPVPLSEKISTIPVSWI